ncbi:MAG: TonB-dependent receptor [Bacteroidota bacterium]
MKKIQYLNHLLLVLFFSCLGSFTYAQGTISGKITSEDGEGISGVTIAVKNSTEGTISGDDGSYSVKASEGQVLIYSFVGYIKEERTVGSSTTINITLIEDILTLSDVVVTATRFPVRKIHTTTAINTVSERSLTLAQPESFAEAIQSIPGLTVENSQGRKANFNIRGFPSGNTYVTSLLDGLPLSGFASRSAGVAEYLGLDKNVERIEVVRGSGATLFGRAAAAGAVNIITKTGGEELGGTVSITRFNNVVGDDHQFAGDFDYRVDFNVNGPLSEKVRFNIGGYRMEDSGYKEWAQKDKGTQFRGNVDFLLSENTNIRVYGMWGNNQFNNLTDSPYDLGAQSLPDGWENFNTYYPNNEQLDFPSTLRTSVFAPLQFTSPILDVNGNEIVQNQADDNREEVIGGHVGVRANIDLGGGWTFVEHLRFQNYGWRDQNEITFSSFYNVDSRILRLNANSNGQISDFISETRIQYMLESGTTTHNFSAGFYISRAAYDRFGGLHWYTADVNPRPTYGWFGPPGTPPQDRFSLSGTTSHQEENVTGIFIGDEINFNDKLRVNAGLRFDRMTGFFNNDPEEIDGLDYDPADLVENELDFSNWSGSVGLNYSLNKRSAVYGSILRGFSLPSVGLATPLPEKDEIVINTELGYRAGFGDFALDLAVFNTVINNRLASVFDPQAVGGQTFIIRPVGKNTVRGTELQLTYAPKQVTGLILRSNITYQASQFDGLQIAIDKTDDDMNPDTPGIPDVDIDGNLFGLNLVTLNAATNDYAIDVTGNQVHNTPNFIFTFNAAYNSKYFGLGYDVVHYAGRYATSLNLYQTPNLSISNFNVYGQLPVADDNIIRLGIRIKNLFNSANPQQLVLGSTNDDILVQRQTTPDFTNVLGFGVIQIPRRILITLSYDF